MIKIFFLFCLTAFSAEDTLKTEDYLQISEVDDIPSRVFSWDAESFKILHVPDNEPPYLMVSGKIREGYEFSIQDKFIITQKGQFKYKLTIPMLPSTTFTIKMFSPKRDFKIYRLITFWKKIPSPLKLKIEEDDKISEKVAGYQYEFPKSTFVQLYSKDNPCPVVDLDNQKSSNLSFRIFDPPESNRTQDAYVFTIKNSSDAVVAEIKKFGPPPKYIDWKDIGKMINESDTYFYQLDTYQNNKLEPGIQNHFDTISGKSMINEPKKIKLEPSQEFGSLYYFDSNSNSMLTPYIAPRFLVLFFDKFIVKASTIFSLYNTNYTQRFHQAKIGLGYRIKGSGDSKTFGSPLFFHIDFNVAYFQNWLPLSLTTNQISGLSASIEPYFVLWEDHGLLLNAEYLTRFAFDYSRLSAGLEYVRFVRSLSLKFVLGGSYDRLFYQVEDPTFSFNAIRGYMRLEYVL
jgi:hypothetical protein